MFDFDWTTARGLDRRTSTVDCSFVESALSRSSQNLEHVSGQKCFIAVRSFTLLAFMSTLTRVNNVKASLTSACRCSEQSRDLLSWFSDTMAPDEYIWPTLNHNPQLHAPGSYKGEFSDDKQ